MKFVDEASITVQSGKGGNGCLSFRRERFIPKGGPDGGDGGDGGRIIIVSSSNKHTLNDFKYNHFLKAQNGANGRSNNKSGKQGDDLIIEVPTGTVVTHLETGDVLMDFTRPDQRIVLLQGGRGGRGNTHFKTSTNRAPRYAQPGEPGTRLRIGLELKLLADVGIIGLPNAGKSTLISRMSAARPKIAGYPFTSLAPNLGAVAAEGLPAFVVADVPGLIEGAHQGSGLGTQFLRHIERTKVLIHLIDVSCLDEKQILSDYRTINAELAHYGRQLAAKPQQIVFNKVDLPGAAQTAARAAEALKESTPVLISALTGQGINHLIRVLSKMLAQADARKGE